MIRKYLKPCSSIKLQHINRTADNYMVEICSSFIYLQKLNLKSLSLCNDIVYLRHTVSTDQNKLIVGFI